MGKVIAIEHLTLDGVMQAPGHPDEDPRDGFTLGGWAAPRQHPMMQDMMGAHMTDRWSLLVGRTTYQRFADFWPKQSPNPFTDALNRVQKYVTSTTLSDHQQWPHSAVLRGDAAESVARLKREVEETLVIFGSGVLVRSLLVKSLVDELLVLIHPLVLGTGRRLFSDGVSPQEMHLQNSLSTPTGVIVASYRAG